MIHVYVKSLCSDSVQPPFKHTAFVFTDAKKIRNGNDGKRRSQHSFRKESQGVNLYVCIQQTGKAYKRNGK